MNRKTIAAAFQSRPRIVTGFIRNPLLVVAALLVLLGAGGYTILLAEMGARQCIQNLRHIYLALELYELDHGTLPHMAFYPDDAWHSPDSMLVVLDPYAITSEIGICPGSHDIVRTHGLSYIWNANLNGRKLHEQDPETWVVTKLSALSDQVPAPHLGRYITLYANGHIARSRRPPGRLTEVQP